MGLQPVAEIMETGVIGDFARIHATRKILDFIGHGVPDAVEFLGGGLGGRFDRMAFFDQWVQIDHLDVIMERFQHNLPCYSVGKTGKRGEDGSFRHDCRLFEVRRRSAMIVNCEL